MSDQSDEIVKIRKRLRKICEWFEALNSRSGADQPDEGITEALREEIQSQNISKADLAAIRATPFKWTRGNPYEWLWILHRYQNTSA